MGAVTVKSIEPTMLPPTVASNSMLLGVLLPVCPTRVTDVVVVIVIVEPFMKVAEPVPLSVRMLNVIGVVFVEGLTVAVVDTGVPSGTKGVLPNETVGFTLSPPLGLKGTSGHCSRVLELFNSALALEVVEPTETAVWIA